ncbi:hypothetical protein CDV55_106303 [Aspergillus turcosus]|nr:hypothetical protein CDV55_106303 [Aspergillus turcosus]
MGVPSPLTSGPTNATGERARYGTLGQSPKATDKYGNRLGGTSGLADQTAQIAKGACKSPIDYGLVPYKIDGETVKRKYTTYNFVRIRNNFPVAAMVKMSHQYASDPLFHSNYSEPIASHSYSTSQPWIIYSRPGEFTRDYWNISVQLDVVAPINSDDTEGTPFKNQKQDKECGIRPEDAGKDITSFIYPTGWTMGIPSGPCADSWITPLGYNTVAFIRIENNFGQNVRYISLTHQYSSDQAYTYDYPYIFQGEESSQLNMVEYNTGAFHPGLDYWTVDVFLEDDKHYQNSKPGKECYLDERDAAAGTLVFGVSESKFHIDLPSASCGDGMKALGQVDVLLGADPHLPYNKNCYLAAHNAFANYAAGYIVANQALSIDTQLSMGVSTLLLDIWVYNDGIYLLHEWGKPIRYLANNPFATPISLLSALKTINQYLSHFNKDVITVMIEDNIDAAHRADLWSIFQSAGVADKVFWPAPAMEKDVNWPTLWSMLYENQRLVVFSDYNGRDKVFPYQWDFMSENVYGAESLDRETWTDLRRGSRESPYGSKNLTAMNHFPWIQAGQERLPNWFSLITHANTPDFIQEHVKSFQDGYDITPNWLNLDFIDIGGGITNTFDCNAALHNRSITEPVKLAAGRFIYKEVFEQPTVDGEPSQVHKVCKHDKMKEDSDKKPPQIDSIRHGTKDGADKHVNDQPKGVKYSHG